MIKSIYKYAIWIKMGFLSQFNFRGIIIDRLLGFLFQFVLMLFFWKAVYSDILEINGRNYTDMLVYMLFSVSISALYLYPTIAFISTDIKSGNITTILLKPIDYQLQFLNKQFGIAVFMFMILMPILTLFLVIVGVGFSWDNLILFLISLFLGFLFNAAFNFLLGVLCFWTENSWGIASFKLALVEILSGTLIPLDLFPAYLHNIIINILPFSKITYYPIMIFQNKLSINDIFISFLNIAIWIALTIICSRILLNKAFKNVINNGG